MDKRKFVVHRHHAERAGLHDDLRIELRKGKLHSWAIPKLIPLKPGRKVLAIETEPHGTSWYNFEGTIDDGYGKGRMEIFDKGDAVIVKHTPGKVIVVKLHGLKGKVNGVYVLVNINKNMKQPQWLLWKRKT